MLLQYGTQYYLSAPIAADVECSIRIAAYCCKPIGGAGNKLAQPRPDLLKELGSLFKRDDDDNDDDNAGKRQHGPN